MNRATQPVIHSLTVPAHEDAVDEEAVQVQHQQLGEPLCRRDERAEALQPSWCWWWRCGQGSANHSIRAMPRNHIVLSMSIVLSKDSPRPPASAEAAPCSPRCRSIAGSSCLFVWLSGYVESVRRVDVVFVMVS